jgi:surfeit locus 1 family protein
MRVQTIDVPSLATTVSQPLFHGVFYQEKSPFQYHYQAVVLPPEKHRAYALQWLLLAIAVVMVAMAASYQKET